jgi:hypothetical protein
MKDELESCSSFILYFRNRPVTLAVLGSGGAGSARPPISSLQTHLTPPCDNAGKKPNKGDVLTFISFG